MSTMSPVSSTVPLCYHLLYTLLCSLPFGPTLEVNPRLVAPRDRDPAIITNYHQHHDHDLSGEWRVVHTPDHIKGKISLFRASVDLPHCDATMGVAGFAVPLWA